MAEDERGVVTFSFVYVRCFGVYAFVSIVFEIMTEGRGSEISTGTY